METFKIQGNPKEIMEQLEEMQTEEERAILEKRMGDGDDAERSEEVDLADFHNDQIYDR